MGKMKDEYGDEKINLINACIESLEKIAATAQAQAQDMRIIKANIQLRDDPDQYYNGAREDTASGWL